MKGLTFARNDRIVQAVQPILNPGGGITAGKTWQLRRISDLALETFPTSFVAEAQFAYIPELVAKVEAATGKVLAVGGDELIVVVEIDRVAVCTVPVVRRTSEWLE